VLQLASTNRDGEMSTAHERSVKTAVIALAGSPNVGKSTVFNLLTGLSQHVGNWSGKTVEQKTGTLRRHDRTVEIVDLPGTYSLTANSAEEQVARDYIIREQPDAVVAVLGAASLERNLYLVAELLELSSPIIVVLNMMDVAKGEGIQVEPDVLGAALGVPVISMVAARGQGVAELLEAVDRVVDGDFPYSPKRPAFAPELERLLDVIEELMGRDAPKLYPSRWVALKLLEGDKEITRLVRESLSIERWQEMEALLRKHEDAVIAIASGRYEWIERLIRAALIRPRSGVISLTERLDRAATHRFFGPSILVGLLGIIFWLVYQLAGPLVQLLDLGVGALADLIRTSLVGAPLWLTGLLADGILGGVGTVLSLVPILVVFFAAMAFLEDVGYMARAAFVADRFMHRIGLHGKSFLPLFLGFGCNVPAVLGARISESERARVLTILLAPLVPCSGRIAVLVFFTGALFGRGAALAALGLVVFNLLVVGLSGIVFSRLLFRGGSPAFIMELPLYHWPNWRTILLVTWQRLVAFVVRAGTLILVVSVVVWIVGALPTGRIETSYLATAGRFLAPLGSLMNLDWRVIVALLTSFVAKENTIATLGVVNPYAGTTLAAALPQMLTPAAAVSFLVVQMLFVPCAATVASIWQETGSWRWTVFSVAYHLVLAFAMGIAVYQGARLLGLGM